MATILQFPPPKPKKPVHGTAIPLGEIPAVRAALFFLSEMESSGGVKLTERGFLGQKFVHKFWETQVDKNEMPTKPRSEEDCVDLVRTFSILGDLCYVEKSEGKVVITELGKRAFSAGASEKLYRDLFRIAAFNWEWGFGDRHEDNEFIQDGVRGLMDTLWDHEAMAINAIEIFQETFCITDKYKGEIDVAAEVRAERADFRFGESTDMVACMQLRFMHRFCVPFGLLRGPESRRFIELDEPFRKTEFLLADSHAILCPIIHDEDLAP